MFKRLIFLCFILFYLGYEGSSQEIEPISINLIKMEFSTLPGKIINVPYFTKNNTVKPIQIITKIYLPSEWNVIINSKPLKIKPTQQKFSIFSVQIPSNYPVGKYSVFISAFNTETNEMLKKIEIEISVLEIENISMQLVESPEHIIAGEVYKATFLLQNFGNTSKKVFVETSNCDVEGSADINLKPGESSQITIFKQTSAELNQVKKEYFSVRALLSGATVQSIFRSMIIFPVKSAKKDLFFRFPVKASTTYLSTNQGDRYRSAYQFEVSGNGSLDPGGKHNFEFLARGPNRTDLSFLGTYDQYFLSYSNKNMELSVGEKSYSFTPLTESSRFGMGVESKVILNNGLSLGYLYVKPRFYESIENEMAFYSQFEKDRNNSIGIYYVLKKNKETADLTYLASINTSFKPFEKTTVDLELSRGLYQGIGDNAFRTNINTQFSIFRLAGNYFYTGKNYPGYYSNSSFYSGTFTAQITPKLNLGMYSRQDFTNAELDTFFITSPYSKMFQSFLSYNIAPRSYLKIYLRKYERKDRLALDKFHYQTKSFNSRFTQKFKKIEYALLGEFGKTTNFLLQEVQNKQNTYRGSADFSYRFNSFHSVRFFGSWSNINSFVSGERRDLTVGFSVSSQISKNLKANLHIQNAYDIDDYYRNRNLMQLNVDYKFWKQHSLSFRSYYTLFTQEINNPEFFLSATYTYKFGIPIKQLMKAGDIKGRVTNDNDEPLEGIILNLLNKKTITDKNGEFSFKSIQPGRFLLSVERTNLEIEELPSIPSPIEIEVIEDRESTLNFRITKGAKLYGKFSILKDNRSAPDDSEVQPNNIIVELKSNFKQYRTTSDKEGKFSFPVVLPGQWTFRIYSKSLPMGYEIEKGLYNFNFSPNEKTDLQISVKRKKRNIIFKSQNISLSNSGNGKIQTLKIPSSKKINSPLTSDTIYYSIQIGAFKNRVNPNSKFFKGKPFDFEKQFNNFYKYFIGKFSSYEEAMQNIEKIRSKYKGAFVVGFINNKLLNLHGK